MRPRRRLLAASVLVMLFMAHDRASQGQAVAPSAAAVVQHVVVIFQENVSFDHYFATYPHAANLPGERAFVPLPGTPPVAGNRSSLPWSYAICSCV